MALPMIPSTTALVVLLSMALGRTGATVGAASSAGRVLADRCGGCNDGTCVKPRVADGSTIYEGTTMGNVRSCDCTGTGFVGDHCEVPCSRECLNGGKCVPAAESKSGEESCACSKAVVDGNPFAGLSCEFGATKSCMTLGSESKHSFCTNGGGCQKIVGDNEQHKDCICNDGFLGPHCEYVAGTEPQPQSSISAATSAENESSQSSQSANPKSDMVVWVMIAVISGLIAVLLLAFVVRARNRRTDAKRRERQAREQTEELSMIPTQDEPENEII